MAACYIPFAFAQGGETEITKTKPSSPPPAAVAPVAPVPAPAAVTPAAPVAPAQKPVSPMGAGAAWQATPQQTPVPVPAPPAEPVVLQESEQALVTKVNDYFNKLTDMQGDFIQTDPDSKQRHGKFYFHYAPPSGLRIISDGRNLVIEDHAVNTSERYPLDVTPFKLLLSEKVDLANDAHVLGVEQGPDTFILTVEEKDSNGSGRIRLFFNKADTILKEWIITDAQGLDTRIEISNQELNKKVSDNFFIISAFSNDQ